MGHALHPRPAGHERAPPRRSAGSWSGLALHVAAMGGDIRVLLKRCSTIQAEQGEGPSGARREAQRQGRVAAAVEEQQRLPAL